jgi:hypothetical protein
MQGGLGISRIPDLNGIHQDVEAPNRFLLRLLLFLADGAIPST